MFRRLTPFGMVVATGLLLLLAGLFAFFYFSANRYQRNQGPKDDGLVSAPSDEAAYSSDEYGLSFHYPSAYLLTEHEKGDGHRKSHEIVLIEDTPENRALLSGETVGEGPPAITIEIFQNDLDHYSTESWIRGTSASNFKLSPEGRLASTTIDGVDALSYRWSGLYEGTSIAQARQRWVYVFSVTYLEMGDRIVQDFGKVRDSMQISNKL